MHSSRVCTDIHEDGFIVFIFDDNTRVKALEVNPQIAAPYIVVDYGTAQSIKTAITNWSNLMCVEGPLEAS